MRIAVVCTNYNKTYDGIGHYTYNLVEAMKKKSQIDEIKVISGVTHNISGLKRFTSRVMANKLENFDYDTIDYLILEYPFQEWNPIILYSLVKIKNRNRNLKLILSLHEYRRVNLFRRKFIDKLINISDGLMVTDNETLELLKSKSNKIITQRPIPSNIKMSMELDKDNNSFCYFGLINKSKAFEQMIEAWKDFNSDNKYKLNIYTSSVLDTTTFSNYGINYFYNLDDLTLSQELWKNKFAILPIKPHISSNNASFKAVIQHKCIPIGIFDRSIKSKNFYLPIYDSSYTKDNIKLALKEAINLSSREYNEKINNIKEDENIFTFDESIEKKILPFLNSIN